MRLFLILISFAVMIPLFVASFYMPVFAATVTLLPGIDPNASQLIGASANIKRCTPELSKTGYPLPDPDCSPGAINPTITLADLQNPNFSTTPLRNIGPNYGLGFSMYLLYGIAYPANNHGSTETCELDHIVPLELGGSDKWQNKWAQCGIDPVTSVPYFREKDKVENYLAKQVIAGKIQLHSAQIGIATDWSQYLPTISAN